MENKNSFFIIRVPMKQELLDGQHISTLNDNVDLICDSMGVGNNLYKLEKKNEDGSVDFIFLFKTKSRKRQGQLNKFCIRYFKESQEFKARGIKKIDYESFIRELKNNKDVSVIEEPNKLGDYNQEDLKIFDDLKNWHKWQFDLYNLLFEGGKKTIFEKEKSVRIPNDREIINIIDPSGSAGKSKFYKWLYANNMDKIGRIGFGTTAQLKSAIVNMGVKEIYIIDLPRTKPVDARVEDIVSLAESLKGGLLEKAMYGSGEVLLLNPPHIIISSNYYMDYSLLSDDRWKPYAIDKASGTMKLLNIKSAVRNYTKQEEENYIEKLKIKRSKSRLRKRMGNRVKEA